MNRNGNIILSSLSEAETFTKTISSIPAGYIEVSLSTRGKVGAPPVVHVRNFKVSEIITLSMSDARELPVRLIGILNNMIIEDTDVSKWNEKEVEELMLYIFMTFYKDTLEEVPFSYDEKDIEYLRNVEGGEEMIKDLEEGKWVPKVSINIPSQVETYDIDDDFDPRITITNRKTGFHVTFDYIKYGDQVTIRQWMDSFFRKEEAEFDKIKKSLEYNRGIMNQMSSNPESIDRLIPIDRDEENRYRDYLMRRAQVITDVSQIISIVDFNGEDVSNLSVGQKYERLANEACLDYGLMSSLNRRMEKMRYGIKTEVSVKDPITSEVVTRPISFRIPSLLQAMQLSGNDNYDNGDYDND